MRGAFRGTILVLFLTTSVLGSGGDPSGLAFLDDRARGEIYSDEIAAKYSVAADPRTDRIAAKLMQVAEVGAARVTVRLVETKAGGVEYEGSPGTYPGGNIYIPRRWLELVGDDDAALAALIAHEVAHCAYLHHGRTAQQEATLDELESGFDKALDGQEGSSRERERMKALFKKTVVSFRLLQQQQQEYEADTFGAIWVLRAGYEFDGALRLLKRIRAKWGDQAYEKPGLLPGVLGSDHPAISQRIENLERTRTKVAETAERFQTGYDAIKQGDFHNAITDFRGILDFFPMSGAAQNNLGCAFMLKYWSSGGAIEPKPALLLDAVLEPELLAKLGGAPPRLSTKGPPGPGPDLPALQEARKAFERSLGFGDNPRARNNLAVALLAQGHHRASLALLAKIESEEDEPRSAVWRNMGIAAFNLSGLDAPWKKSMTDKGIRAWESYLRTKEDPEILEKLEVWKRRGPR